MSTIGPNVDVRAVQDMTELKKAFASIAPLFEASVDSIQDYRLDRLIEHFDADQEFMLVAIDSDGSICGAALGYRESVAALKLQALAVKPAFRRRGLGARLLGELEGRAQRSGCTSIYLGAEQPARPFYEALGYRGRRSILGKSLTGAALTSTPDERHKRLMALKAARARRQQGVGPTST